VEKQEIVADGKLRPVSFGIDRADSSWIALRILPSVHSAPLYVSVAARPLRASKRSAQWCLDCLEVIWKEHGHRIRESERAAAVAAWDHARATYRRILAECEPGT
jgi:hypothetical protein